MSEPLPVPPALDAACTARDRGWRPFPVDHPALPSCAGAHGNVPCNGQRGKHPTGGWAAQAASSPSDKLLELWFGPEPRNVGIACGPSGLVVLDEDELGALTSLAARLGETLPATYRVRTARGWHYYFAAPEDQVIGNRAGALAEHHIDVRGGKGGGGYVVGAGSVHVSGHVYTAENPNAPLADLPAWIITQIQTQPERPDAPAGTSGPMDWTDDPRLGSEDELRGQFERRLDQIRGKGNTFREQLYLAARDGWRLVDLGVLDEHGMLRALREAVVRVWGLPPDDRDKRIVYDEARPDAQSSPWMLAGGTVIGEHDETYAPEPGLDGERVLETEEQRANRLLRKAVDARKEQILADRQARREIAALDAEGRPRLADGLIDVRDLYKVEAPRMLMEGLIPADAVGFLAGKSGSYKSFLAVSWACHLAAGQPWLGRPEFGVPNRQKVLYIAAEGAAGVAQRIQAWEHAHVELPAGSLVVYPRPIKLNNDLIADELHELVGTRGFDVVIVDTYHRSAAGTDENDSTDFSIVFEAVARLRDDHGCTTLFLDHTGHGGGRPRGTSAKIDDSDYVISTDYEGLDRSRSVQRTLSMFKLKDQDTEGRWPIRLVSVPEIAPDGSAYLEIGAVDDDASPFNSTGRWYDLDAVEVPAELAGLTGKGSNVARDVFRLLRYIEEVEGLTSSEIRKGLAECAREYADSVYFAGIALLKKRAVLVPGKTPSRLALAPRFDAPNTTS